MGNVYTQSIDEKVLSLENLVANIAIDMFLDSDAETAVNSARAKYEVMVWFAAFGELV